MFYKIGVLKNFAKLTGKTCAGIFSSKVTGVIFGCLSSHMFLSLYSNVHFSSELKCKRTRKLCLLKQVNGYTL